MNGLENSGMGGSKAQAPPVDGLAEDESDEDVPFKWDDSDLLPCSAVDLTDAAAERLYRIIRTERAKQKAAPRGEPLDPESAAEKVQA